MNKIFCDIFISGAGIIGSTLALRLAQFGFQVIIINSELPIFISNRSNPPDLRVSAINISSVELLKQVDIWEKISSYFYVPFHKLEIWECISSTVIFNSSLLNLSNMGLIVENKRLQFALWESFLDYNNSITFYCPCSLNSMYYNGKYWKLQLNNGKIINSRLLIGADGKDSLVRNNIGIGITGWQYRQFCMLLSIKYSQDQEGTVWQIFTPFGPRGFLPLYNNWGSLMWYDNIDYIRYLQKLPVPVLEKKIQKNFGVRLGAVKLYKNICFPLVRQHANSYVKDGLVLVGDSAHTINPLAGQGINLGLCDVKSLVKILVSARDNGESWNTLKILQRYENNRWYDNSIMQIGIDALYVIFSNDVLFIQWIRNISLMLLERSPLLKKYILRYALGFEF